MKSRIEIIQEKHYSPLHKYLCNFISSLEEQAEHLLKQRKFIDHLVQKKFVLGNTYSSEAKSIYRSMFYFLEYTFFEDVEDEHGYRENDVRIGFSVGYYINNEIGIRRDITSDHEDICYPDIDRHTSISQDDFEVIDKMKADFLKVLNIFIDKSNLVNRNS